MPEPDLHDGMRMVRNMRIFKGSAAVRALLVVWLLSLGAGASYANRRMVATQMPLYDPTSVYVLFQPGASASSILAFQRSYCSAAMQPMTYYFGPNDSRPAYLVTLKPGVSVSDLQALSGVTQAQTPAQRLSQFARARMTASTTATTAAAIIHNPAVALVAPRFVRCMLQGIPPPPVGGGGGSTGSTDFGPTPAPISNFTFPTPAAVPNDPLFSDQWALDSNHLEALQAWGIEPSAGRGINVAVLDTGYDVTHEDLQTGMEITRSRNWTVASTDPEFYIVSPEPLVDDLTTGSMYDHGTATSGLIVATHNNGLGISGLAYNSKVWFEKVFGFFTVGGAVAYAVDVNAESLALQYVADNGSRIVNMSYGGPAYDAQENTALQYAINKGLILVAASGNSASDPSAFMHLVMYPAATPGVWAVGASNFYNSATDFSNWNAPDFVSVAGQPLLPSAHDVDFLAPGGACPPTTGTGGTGTGGTGTGATTPTTPCTTGGILTTVSLLNYGLTYDYLEGTSFATPYVSSVAALVLGRNPNLKASDVYNIISESVRPANIPETGVPTPPTGQTTDAGVGSTGQVTPDKESGFGVVDAARALAYTPPALILSASPPNGTVTANSTPTVSFQLDAADVQGFVFMLNNRVLWQYAAPTIIPPPPGVTPQPPSVETDPVTGTTYDPSTGILKVRLPYASQAFPIPQGQALTFTVQAWGGLIAQTAPQSLSTTLTIQPHYLPAGISFVGIPFGLSGNAAQPNYVFSGASFQIARWDPTLNSYHVYPSDTMASFLPADATSATPIVVSPPAGLGYWIYVPQPSPLHIEGTDIAAVPYSINLSAGWNQVGNPFAFGIDWNASQVSVGGQTDTLAAAGAVNWIAPTAYVYSAGGYTALTAPSTNALPIPAFQGFWVYAYRSATLTLQPNPLSSAIATP